MKIVVTGAGGFVGQRVVRALLQAGQVLGRDGAMAPITTLVATDQSPLTAPDLTADPRLTQVTGDLLGLIGQGVIRDADGVFHLSAAVSGECEADFDLGMRANFDTTRALLDAARAGGRVPRLVFSSSCAVFGGEGARGLIDDATTPTPQTSYGIQKYIGEQLVADYTRKGFIDGRSLRLATVAVRAGRPNGAASGFVSGIIREPLAGEDAPCPVAPGAAMWVSSPDHSVAGIVRAFNIPQAEWGPPTGLNLPGITITVAAMLESLGRLAGPEVAARVKMAPDPAIERIVAGWPSRFVTPRADRLGLTRPDTIDAVITAYMAEIGRQRRPA